MEVRKNDIVNGVITDMNDDGQGVLKLENNIVVFIPNSLTGEQVEAQIINTKSKYAIGKVNEFLSTSSERQNPACKYFTKCGGCDIMHCNKQLQLIFKTNKVKQSFKKIAGIDVDVNTCISLNDFRYRNKIALPVSKNGEIGLYRKNSHTVLPIEDCLITQEWNNNLITCIKEYLKTAKISCYNEDTKKGLLKHIVARKIKDAILITLVVTEQKVPQLDILTNLLKTKFSNFGLNLNINRLQNNVILANKWTHIYGPKELIADEFGISYPVSNASFFQVNNEIKTAIYNKVLSYIDKDSIVIDAYSGAGLLSGIISKHAKKCYGVEIIPEATQNANELKNKNNLKNLENINGDCAIEIPKLIKSLKSSNTIVTLDPPRKGCDKKVLDAIINSKPNKIIYISCDPATLARDAKIILESAHYKINEIQPYDMFPQTKHVETVVCFEKL